MPKTRTVVDSGAYNMTTKSKLAIIPEGYKVVPEEPTPEMYKAVNKRENESAIGNYGAMPEFDEYWAVAIDSAPQPNTPPVLRWEGGTLVIGKTSLASIGEHNGVWYVATKVGVYSNEQEARRAAEKALGFPDGLVVEVV